MKTCSQCGKSKPLADFHKKSSSKDGRQSKCKECNKTSVRRWQDENPERFEANWKRNSYGTEAIVKRRAAKYGLSVDELLALLEESGGVCNICKREPYKWLVIDHCHKSLKVRGVLCEKCNQALGLLDDNIEYLKSAIEYLQQ